MIAKRNEFVKKTVGHRAGCAAAADRTYAGDSRQGDMEILILKRVWKNFGTGVKGERRREF